MFLLNSIHISLLMGKWLDQQHKIGTVNIISPHNGLENLKNEELKNEIEIIEAPKFWNTVHSTNSWTILSIGGREGCIANKGQDQKLYIIAHNDFGLVYIKKLNKNATTPR